MPRLIARTATALAAIMLATVPAGAVDLSGGTLRGAAPQPDASGLDDLAALDVGDPVPSAEDQLDAIAAEDAASGIELSATFVPLGDDEPSDPVETRSIGMDGETDMMGSFAPRERFVESIPVLAAPDDGGFRPVLPRASASVVPLGSWTRNNPRASTVVLGGSWDVR